MLLQQLLSLSHTKTGEKITSSGNTMKSGEERFSHGFVSGFLLLLFLQLSLWENICIFLVPVSLFEYIQWERLLGGVKIILLIFLALVVGLHPLVLSSYFFKKVPISFCRFPYFSATAVAGKTFFSCHLFWVFSFFSAYCTLSANFY